MPTQCRRSIPPRAEIELSIPATVFEVGLDP